MRYADDAITPPFAKDPGVCHYDGRYWLYYTRRPTEDCDRYTIGVATSVDAESWQRRTVLPPDFGDPGLAAPSVAVRDGAIHLFCQTYGDFGEEGIWHAVSADGETFAPNPHNPIFRPTGDWTSGRAIDAETIHVGDRCYCYYATRDPSGERQVLGLASAPIASGFAPEDWRQHGDGPILEPEREWETDCIEAPAVCEHDGRYYLFYGGGYCTDPQQIGCAVSEDGVEWERVSDDPLLAVDPGTWRADSTGHPDVFTAPEDTTWLFYQGTDDGGESYAISKARVEWVDGTPRIEE
jgi:predicted GH43/DUF377 family glycosyl hydrolase